MRKTIIALCIILLLTTGCSLGRNGKDLEIQTFCDIEKMSMQLVVDQQFLSFVDTLEDEADDQTVTSFSIDYSHFDHPEVPEGCDIYIAQSLNPSIGDSSILPKQAITDSFLALTSMHGDLTEFQSVTVNKENGREWVSFRVSQERFHINDVHLVKGDPHDALYQTGIFYGNPGLNVHWKMEYVQLTEEWYLVWFYLADET